MISRCNKYICGIRIKICIIRIIIFIRPSIDLGNISLRLYFVVINETGYPRGLYPGKSGNLFLDDFRLTYDIWDEIYFIISSISSKLSEASFIFKGIVGEVIIDSSTSEGSSIFVTSI